MNVVVDYYDLFILAPPSENDTEAYITSVSHRTGVSPDTRIDMHDLGVARLIVDALTDGDYFRLIEYSNDLLLNCDVAIRWRNATRIWLNRRKRQLLGHDSRVFRAGEPIMLLRNRYDLQVFNGEIYPLARDREPGEDAVLITPRGKVTVMNAVFEGDHGYDKKKELDSYVAMTPAYACTAHKFQGSEAPSVLVIDEMNGTNDDYNSWLYTAMTGASKRVMLVRSRFA